MKKHLVWSTMVNVPHNIGRLQRNLEHGVLIPQGLHHMYNIPNLSKVLLK